MKRFIPAVLLAACAVSGTPASAQLLEDVSVRSEQGVAEIRMRFSAPVRYIKHFPAGHGELIKLYLQVLTLGSAPEENPQEYKRIPTMALVPSFKVTYSTVRSCHAVQDPLCLDIQFDKPVRFRISQGEDGRSILLYVLPNTNPRHAAPG